MKRVPKVEFQIASKEYYAPIILSFLSRGGDFADRIYNLYPELKKVTEKKNPEQAVLDYFEKWEEKNYSKLENAKKRFQCSWDKHNDKLVNAIAKVHETEWPEGLETIAVNITPNPICPRDLETNSFDLYHDFNEEEMKKHADYIHKRELDFTSANNPRVQDFFKRRFGINNPNEIIAKWKEEKSKEKNSLMEMAVTALLFEKLGDDFLVVRTATYDDYKNGADNLIIDRKTGEVVGAFDEVHDSGGGKYTEAKEKKIINIAKKGGTEINYGLKLVDGKFVRAELKSVPVFYLGLEESEFEKLKNGLVNNNTEMKDEIFDKLIESLSTQYRLLKQYGKTDEFRTNLNSLGTFLSRIMENKELEIAM